MEDIDKLLYSNKLLPLKNLKILTWIVSKPKEVIKFINQLKLQIRELDKKANHLDQFIKDREQQRNRDHQEYGKLWKNNWTWTFYDTNNTGNLDSQWSYINKTIG